MYISSFRPVVSVLSSPSSSSVRPSRRLGRRLRSFSVRRVVAVVRPSNYYLHDFAQHMSPGEVRCGGLRVLQSSIIVSETC